jgi:hypothetical protein
MSMGSGAAEGLQQVLQRLFLEAKFKQDQREHADRQGLAQQELGLRGRGLDIQEEGNRINAGLRSDSLKATQQERLRQDEDRNEANYDRKTQRIQGTLGMLKEGAPLDNPDLLVGMGERGMGGMMRPVPNEPRFEFAGTQDAANKEATLNQRTDAADKLAGYRDESLKIREDMLKDRQERTNWGPPVIQIHTSDPNGNAVTKVLPRTEAAGQTFDAAPTSEARNRQGALKRVAPIMDAIDELSTRINVNQGIAATAIGAAERQKAKINLNDDISEYNGVVQGFTPMLARAVGHVGILTQQDVDSVREALPKPEDSKSVRDRKMSRIQSLMQAGLPQGTTLGQALSGDGGQTGGPSTGAPKAGDTKTFPNGAKAVHDGKGWVKQ